MHSDSTRLHSGSSVNDKSYNKSHVTDKGHVTNSDKDRGDNVKEGKSLQRRRSNSFDKENRRISGRINKFQHLNEQSNKDREKDRNANYLLHKDGTKNKVEKFEKEIESQDSPRKDNSIRSPRCKEVRPKAILFCLLFFDCLTAC